MGFPMSFSNENGSLSALTSHRKGHNLTQSQPRPPLIACSEHGQTQRPTKAFWTMHLTVIVMGERRGGAGLGKASSSKV